MIVLFEGVSLVGKSTVANRLCESLPGFVHCPLPTCISRRRAEVHARNDHQELYEFYSTAVRVQSLALSALEKEHPNKTIVLVRYWPSVLAYFHTLDIEVSKEHFGPIREPDVIVHLTRHPARLRSLRNLHNYYRPADPFDLYMDSKHEEVEEAFQEIAYEAHPPKHLIRIKTDTREAEETQAEVLRKLTLYAMA